MQKQGLSFSLFITFSIAVCGQKLHHQTLGAQGSTALLSSGIFVSQSIGQQSVTGAAQINNMSVLQGFQQSSKAIRYVTAGLPSSTNLKTFPNPFSDQLNFQFDTEVSGDVEISVFDSAGRLLLRKSIRASESRANVALGNLQSGLYHIELINKGQKFHTTVIRK